MEQTIEQEPGCRLTDEQSAGGARPLTGVPATPANGKQAASTAAQAPKRLTVFYDGACPLCDREISFYRRRNGADRIEWLDINSLPGDQVVPGLSKEKALARFHVAGPDGTLSSGGLGFAKLWESLPGFRFAGRLVGTPPVSWVAEGFYRLFLLVRPRLQRAMVKRGGAEVGGRSTEL